MENNNSKKDSRYTSGPPFSTGYKNNRKKLKRNDFPNLTDEQFKMIQAINDTSGEGFS